MRRCTRLTRGVGKLVGEHARLTDATAPDRDIAADRHRTRGHGVGERSRNAVVMDTDVSEQPPAGALELPPGTLGQRTPATA